MKRGREIDSNRSHSERGCEIESSTTKGGTASRTREGSRGDAPRAHTYIFFLWLFNNNLIVFRHNWEGQATVGGAPAETGRTPTQARGPGGAAKTPEEHQRQDQLCQERGAKGSPPARTRPTTTGCRCRRGGTMGSHLRQRRPPTCSGGGVPPPCNRQLPFLFFHFFFFRLPPVTCAMMFLPFHACWKRTNASPSRSQHPPQTRQDTFKGVHMKCHSLFTVIVRSSETSSSTSRILEPMDDDIHSSSVPSVGM